MHGNVSQANIVYFWRLLYTTNVRCFMRIHPVCSHNSTTKLNMYPIALKHNAQKSWLKSNLKKSTLNEESQNILLTF